MTLKAAAGSCLRLPPLRARREDIEPLAQSVLGRVCARHGRALRFSPDALRVLLRHDWPGNVRELENAVEYAVAVCRGQTVLPEDLPDLTAAPSGAPAAEATGPPSGVAASAASGLSVRGRVRAPEVEALRKVLDENRWNRESAARALGISRTTLWRRMREAGLL